MEDVEDYLHGILPGMQAFLKDFVQSEEPADEAWRSNQAGEYPTKLISTENVKGLWRILKTLTEGEA